MIRLTCDDRCNGRQRHQRKDRPGWSEFEKGIAVNGRMLEQERGLAGIIEQQRRQHDRIPGRTDGVATDMSHVGVERLAAGDREKDPTKRGKAGPPTPRQEADRIAWIYRREHSRMMHDTSDAEHGEDDEPQQHHRSRDLAYARRPPGSEWRTDRAG
jgi:hypothetical protein